MPLSPRPNPISPPRQRQGYEIDYGAPRQRVGYNVDGPRGNKGVEFESWWKRPATEAHLGLITFGGGAIWATKVETIDISNFVHLLMTPGPLELSAIGLLIWLHAKWRLSVRIK